MIKPVRAAGCQGVLSLIVRSEQRSKRNNRNDIHVFAPPFLTQSLSGLFLILVILFVIGFIRIQKKDSMNSRKKMIFVLLIGGYLFCLFAGISGAFPFLNQYSDGSDNGDGSGFLWELCGIFCWMGLLPLIPDKYSIKNSKWFTAFLIGPVLLLTAISFIKSSLP